jgi:hypothetical protein
MSDAVSREAVLEALARYQLGRDDDSLMYLGTKEALKKARERVRAIPAAPMRITREQFERMYDVLCDAMEEEWTSRYTLPRMLAAAGIEVEAEA